MEAGGIILAGGRSSRFKENKALVKVASQRLIDRIVGVLSTVFPSLILVTNSPLDFKGVRAEIVTDIIPGRGPLSGIHSGLIASPYDLNFVVACDMPFINARLVKYLIERANPSFDAVVPVVRGYPEPLAAVYRRSCLPCIERFLLAERYKVTDFYHHIKVAYVKEEELASLIEPNTFFNINTWDDLKKAFPEEEENQQSE